MTESRDALGSQHFPANRGGTYVAGSLVGTDVGLFDWHVQRAADLEPAVAVAHYRTALDLVTGKPFSSPNASRASSGPVDFEPHATTWELRVAQVAQACPALHVDLGEPHAATVMLPRTAYATPRNGAPGHP